MPHPISEEIRRLDADLDIVRFPAASSIRARGKRRARRQRAVGVAAVATVVALAGGGFALSANSPSGTTVVGGSPQPSCVTPAGPVDLTLPNSPGEVSLQVVDATGQPQRSTDLADQLRTRGFAVSSGPAAGSGQSTTTTVIAYGPGAIGAASLLKAYVDGPVSMILVPDRAGRTVDLVLGEPEVRLHSPTEVNQTLVQAGEPTLPAELCAAGRTGK